MTKTTIINDMKRDIGSSWCTLKELADYFGYKEPESVRKFTYNCTRVGNKYPIVEIVEQIIQVSIAEEQAAAQ